LRIPYAVDRNREDIKEPKRVPGNSISLAGRADNVLASSANHLPHANRQLWFVPLFRVPDDTTGEMFAARYAKRQEIMSSSDKYIQNPAHQQWLEQFLQEFGAVAGSVHEQRGNDLYLTAALSLPPPVIAAVAFVPHGKGMAGLAQVRKAPVQTCNLQTDEGGTVKPGAKAVNARAGIAVPVLSPGGDVMAVVGAAWMSEREIAPERAEAIMQSASSLPLRTGGIT
jgi:hypothetical protein